MGKRNHARVVLTDYKERKADEGAIDVILPDESVFRIPPPELWPDEVYAKVQASQAPGGEPYGIEAQARGIVGDEAFNHFLEQGGTAVLFHSLMQSEHGTDMGESSASR